MHILDAERVRLRNWKETDRDLFHEINADRKVMEFFPFRRTKAESDVLFDKVRGMIDDTGLGFYALVDRISDEPMGFCGLSRPNLEPQLETQGVEIGWRLATRFWGKGYVTEAAAALMQHGFVTVQLPEIVSFAVSANHRSTAVMERLGMRRDPGRDFDHPRVPDSHPQLRRHVVYVVTNQEWLARQAGKP
ncbi:GNAT family N-acetyltransferase [Rhizobium sp. LjRoot30]|uniref:GNAT family N-acetyltransferase n=1 Tax=Rhizobium sp. LjRoot30 TaxID=3342320 RepID=UPI003ED17216